MTVWLPSACFYRDLNGHVTIKTMIDKNIGLLPKLNNLQEQVPIYLQRLPKVGSNVDTS